MRSSNENQVVAEQPLNMQQQDLDLTLKAKINSEHINSKEPLMPSLAKANAAGENGPLSERLVSNFDNQTNVKISN